MFELLDVMTGSYQGSLERVKAKAEEHLARQLPESQLIRVNMQCFRANGTKLQPTKEWEEVCHDREDLEKLKGCLPGQTVFFPTNTSIEEMTVIFLCDHEGGVGVYGHPVGGVGGTTVKLSHVWISREELEEYLEREAYESDPRNQPIE